MESALLYYIFDTETILGRIELLLSDDALHINAMSGDKIRIEQDDYLWGGWSLRFYQGVNDYHSIAYFSSALISLLYIHNKDFIADFFKNHPDQSILNDSERVKEGLAKIF